MQSGRAVDKRCPLRRNTRPCRQRPHVAIGGSLGAVGRYARQSRVFTADGPGFPLGAMTANVIGLVSHGVFLVLAATLGLYSILSPFVDEGLWAASPPLGLSLRDDDPSEGGDWGQAAPYVVNGRGASVGGLPLASSWRGASSMRASIWFQISRVPGAEPRFGIEDGPADRELPPGRKATSGSTAGSVRRFPHVSQGGSRRLSARRNPPREEPVKASTRVE